jgi:hypothetical protein
MLARGAVRRYLPGHHHILARGLRLFIPCRTLLISSLATMQVLVANHARSGEGSAGRPVPRCYVVCQGSCQIYRGPRFSEAKVIYDETTGYINGLRAMLGLGGRPMPVADAYLQLQMAMKCALGPPAEPE